jgi:hypothetical protein
MDYVNDICVVRGVRRLGWGRRGVKMINQPHANIVFLARRR